MFEARRESRDLMNCSLKLMGVLGLLSLRVFQRLKGDFVLPVSLLATPEYILGTGAHFK